MLAKLLVLAVAVCLGALSAAHAEGQHPSPGPRLSRVTEGTLFWRATRHDELKPAPVLETDVDLRVTGLIVRATVRQQFTNPSGDWAEGVYVFPLPETAAVDHMRMRVGERLIEGVIREKTAAKDIYERAKQEGSRASLVEQERPNVFTTSVANIPPGASIGVEIEYQQIVRYDEGQFRLRFPMVVGPRYIPGNAVDDASRITPPVAPPDRGPLNPVRLRIDLAPGVPLARLEAPYHRIRTTAGHDGRYRIALAEDSVPADRDFELRWEPTAGEAPTAAVFTESRGTDVFSLLMVMPPAQTDRRVAREAIFVVDTSGSMHGASVEQAKAALILALSRLTPADTFNVIQFSSHTHVLFSHPRPATLAHQQAAIAYVNGLRAEGGTEMLPALTRALDGRPHDGRLRQVIFLTDGAVGNEDALFATIRERLGDTRLFTVGIGSAPNSHFMRQAARQGRGTFTHIGSTTEVRDRMEALFRKLESPVLTDVRLELRDVAGAEIFPDPVPDLYLGEPVIVTLRADALPSLAVLRGRLGAVPWEHELSLQEARPGAGLAVHWAREKIAAILEHRLAGVSEDDIRHAVLDVALTHHLVTRYTSLVAVDVTPIRPGQEALHRHALATNLPHGWEYTEVFGLGQGATAGPFHLMVGLLALGLALATYALGRGRLT